MLKDDNQETFRPYAETKLKWKTLSPESKKEESDSIVTKLQKYWKGFQTRKEYKWIIDQVKSSRGGSAREHIHVASQIRGATNILSLGRENEILDASPERNERRRPEEKSIRMQSKKAEKKLEYEAFEVSPQKMRKYSSTALNKEHELKRTKSIDLDLMEFQKSPEGKSIVDERLEEFKRTYKARMIPALNKMDPNDILFVQSEIIPSLIESTCLYSESLELSRQIQGKYEQRPVCKDLFAFSQEFQYTVVNPLPHSLHVINSLGRVGFLETVGNFNQIDVTSAKQLSSFFLGNRLPLQYTPLIDMVCEAKSCRLYTLNALWKLEVWSLEQLTSLPIKRVPMVNCEVTKDYIQQAYKYRHLLSKPSFLSIQDCANQILVVNTSAVDGNVVFLDPISLSVLKRIHLQFSDHEIPTHVKKAIDKLQSILSGRLHPDQDNLRNILKKMTKDGKIQELTYDDFVHELSPLCKEIDPSLRNK